MTREPLFCLWVWREGLTARVFRWLVVIKTPKAPAYFSERNGYHKPLLRAGGWRLFIDPPSPMISAEGVAAPQLREEN